MGQTLEVKPSQWPPMGGRPSSFHFKQLQVLASSRFGDTQLGGGINSTHYTTRVSWLC